MPISAESPNYQKAAVQQQQSSKEAVGQQTEANRPNQTNAFGSEVKWEQGPDGQWRQSQSFGGPLAGLATDLQGQAASAMSNPFDMGQFGQAGTGDQARDQAIQAAYGQATSRLDPQWNQRGEGLRTQLLNQGLDPNSEAYRNAMGEFDRSRNDAYGSAMNSAIGMGQSAGDSVFRNNMMARQQAIADALRGRGQALGELGQLGGFLGQQGFMGAGAADPLQALAAAMGQGNFNLANAEQQNQFWADIIGAGGKAATAAVGLPFGFK